MTIDASAPGSLDERLRHLPKPDLHLHALGALRSKTLLELARREDSPLLVEAERCVERGFRFDDLSGFVAFYIGLFDLLHRPGDFERVTFEVLEDAAAEGVRYAELRWTPASHVARGADEDRMFDAFSAGRCEAARAFGIESRLIVDFPRSLPFEVAEATLTIALRRRTQGVTGFDVAGDEHAVAASPAFAPLFAAAHAAGLGCTAHAGEGAGPKSVRGALDLYGARRIGHGTRAVEDEDLVARLARERVVLEVCPTSNEALGVVPAVRAHPVRAFLAAGVPCTVATDDPSLFGTSLVREYRRLHDEVGVSLSDLAQMAATGFDAAFLEASEEGHATRARLRAWREEALAWKAAV